MAFNYSRSPHLISQHELGFSYVRFDDYINIFRSSFPSFDCRKFAPEKEEENITEKAIHLCRSVFSFYTFWHIRKWKMIRHLSTEIEADILYRWWRWEGSESTRKASTFFKRRAVLLMSRCRIAFVRVLGERGLLLRNDQFNKTFHSLSLWSDDGGRGGRRRMSYGFSIVARDLAIFHRALSGKRHRVERLIHDVIVLANSLRNEQVIAKSRKTICSQ